MELWFRSMKLKPYGLTNTKNRWLLSHRRGDIIRIVYIIWKDGGRIIPGSCGAVKRMLWELKTGMCRIRELGLLYEAYSGVRGGGSLSDDEIRKNKQLFNDTLKEKGGVPLSDAVYWTSAECSARMAYAFDMASGAMIEMPQELDKGMKYKFRAMADFKF